MPVSWLPRNYYAARSLKQAGSDLLAISDGGALSEAHVTVEPDSGETTTTTGRLGARLTADGALAVTVDEARSFELSAGNFRGGWLTTFDGADYYVLSVDLGWGVAHIRDAYNGL